MLKLLLSIISLLLMTKLMNRYWWISMSSLLILSPLFMIHLISSNNLWMVSPFSGLDLMSSSLMILSVIVASLMLMASSKIFLMNNNKLFMFMNISLLLILLLCFSSSNLFSFYIWFEASLIPTLIIIMMWGYQPERMQASMYLMLYTITASLPMFIIFCSIYLSSNHAIISLNYLMKFPMSMTNSIFMIMVLAGFLVKLPMFTVHLWLPKAHVEAPIAGSMVLAAILLKLGGYGLARLIIMFPYTMNLSNSMLLSVTLCGAATTSILCMRQPDLKSLIAYSSVGHMGLMLAGMLASSTWGLTGALLMMIAHGLSSSALFALANMSYEMTHTRSMFLSKGLMCTTPIMSMWWFMFTAANMAAPPSINLLSEIMLISATMSSSIYALIPISLISFFTAAYSLHMFSSTQHGQISTFSNPMSSMKPKDMLMLMIHLIPLIILIAKPEMISLWM